MGWSKRDKIEARAAALQAKQAELDRKRALALCTIAPTEANRAEVDAHVHERVEALKRKHEQTMLVNSTLARRGMSQVGATEVFGQLFAHARSESFIAIEAERPSATNQQPHPWAWTAVDPPRHQAMLPGILEAGMSRQMRLYFIPNPLHKRVLDKFGGDPQAYYERAMAGENPYYKATDAAVFELAAIGVDLDVGREGRPTAGTAYGCLLDLAIEGKIPMPSLTAFSGRGVYAFWALREPAGEGLPLASRDNVDLWRRCGQCIRSKLECLYADRQASNLARLFKLPDSIANADTMQKVYYLAAFGTGGRIPRYTLDDLRDAIGLVAAPSIDAEVVTLARAHPRELPLPTRRPGARGRVVQPGKGAEPSRAIVRDLESVMGHRGGMTEGGSGGCGRYWLLVRYFTNERKAQFILRKGLPRDERSAAATHAAAEQTYRFNLAYCKPPVLAEELRRVCETSPGKRFKRAGIVAGLRIGADEARELGLRTLVPDQVRAERKAARAATTTRLAGERERIDAALVESANPDRDLAKIARAAVTSYMRVKKRLAALRRDGRLPPRSPDGQSHLPPTDGQ